jgi:hypothetical protein
MKVEEQDRNMFLVQDIVKVLLYKGDKKKHLDSFAIRNLASQ